MPDPLLKITVYADEVVFRLDQFPKRLRAALQQKFEEAFSQVRESLFTSLPGKYLDPSTVVSGVTQQGSTVIGFIEATDKPGFYLILPSKARALAFLSKEGEYVRTPRVLHPFLKGTPLIAQHLLELKPWLEEQVYDTLNEVR